jgi:hypothetical protein
VSASAILILGLALVLALPLAWRALARRLDPFEPLVLFALAYGAMFVARPASMLVHGELSYGEVDLRRTFPAATALALAGGVAFLCGYELRAGAALARRLPPPRRIATRAAVTCSIALTVLAALALLALVTRFSGLSALRILVHGRSEEEARLSHESSYVWYAARLFVPAALCLLALALRERSRRIGVAAALLIAASLLVTIPLGSRIFLLPLLGGIFVLVYVRRGTRPSPLLLAVLAVAALFASYAAVIVREPERRQNAGAQFALLVHRPYHLFDLILYRGDAEMAPVLAGALTVVPERFGYRYGRASVGEIVVRPIPRQLWHGKPEPGDERIVAAVWPRLSGHFHPSFSSLLSFYWDFGIAGVMWGMAVFGIGCRALYEWFRRHADSFAAQLIYSAALWYVVVGVRDQPVDTIVLASFVVLPLILLERFSASRWASVRRSLARARVSQR